MDNGHAELEENTEQESIGGRGGQAQVQVTEQSNTTYVVAGPRRLTSPPSTYDSPEEDDSAPPGNIDEVPITTISFRPHERAHTAKHTSVIKKKLPRVMIPPADLASHTPKMRSRPSRSDLYEGPRDNIDNGDVAAGDEFEEPRTKRTKFNRKESKQPLHSATSNKTPNQHIRSDSARPDPGKSVVDPGTITNSSSITEYPSAADASTNPPKRGRGRPKKSQAQAHSRGSEAAALKRPHASGQVVTSEASAAVEAKSSNVDEIVEVEEGQGLYLNPSPAKPPHPPVNTAAQDVAQCRGTSSEDESGSEADIDDPILNFPQASGRRKVTSIVDGEFRVDMELLENMSEETRRIGHKYDSKNQAWSKEKSDDLKIYSVEGKRLNRRLKLLSKAYHDLEKIQEAGHPVGDAEASVATLVTALKDEINRIFTVRLAKGVPYFDTKPTQIILYDLYYNLIPNFVETVKIGIETRNKDGPIEVVRLEELADLLGLLLTLSETALDQPSDSQPGSRLYQTQGPIRRILPFIRGLRRNLQKEIHRKRTNQQRLEIEGEEKIREIENKRRIKEVRRLQKEALDENFNHPVWGKIMKAALRKEEAKQAARSNEIRPLQEPSSQNHRRSQEDSQEDDNSFAVDSFDFEFERVRMFGKKSAREKGTRKMLSDSDKTAFINIIRQERGMACNSSYRSFKRS